jgi:flagellar biosynthetic protein FliQ
MGPGEAVDILREALGLLLVLAAPVLLTGLVVGVAVSLLQAVTQIQEQTLSLVPKILAMLIAVMLLGPWMLDRLVEFGRRMFGSG